MFGSAGAGAGAERAHGGTRGLHQPGRAAAVPRWLRSQAQTSPPPPRPPRALRAAAPAGREVSAAPAAGTSRARRSGCRRSGAPLAILTHTQTSLSCRSLSAVSRLPPALLLSCFLSPAHSRWFSPPPEAAAPPPPFRLPSSFSFCLIK